jgi:PAS domain S-box-containing protein
VEVRVGLLEKNGSTLMVAVARDVSRRREAEEERDRFFTLSPDMMAIIGADGYVKRLNPAFAATLGHTETEMMSRPILDFVHPDDLEATVAEIANIYSGLNPRPFENRNICSDGSYKWLRWTAAPYADMCYSVAHDITAVKLAAIDLLSANEVLEKRVADRTAQLESSHAEMAVAKKEAERANAAKSDFLSRMSHELRTPMNSIMGFAQIIEMDEPEGKHATRVEHILRGGQHLLRLINEVLDLARVESGRLELSLEPVSLRLAIRNAVEMMQPLCEQRNQQIICNLGDCDNHYVQVDQQRFSQVLLNLLSNATKYNPVGGSIVVTCEPEIDGYLRFSIRDTGIGIPSDQISKIFEPFERLGDADNKIEGTGLGLALAKRLIENMGGKVKAESVVGVGSLFTVDLVKAKCPSHEIACNKQDAMFRCIDPRQKVILYIEDNEANLHLISDLFSRNNRYHLLSAQTGLAGLEIAHKERPDLILLDLHLPGFSGNEVLIRLKEDVSTRKIPVVIVSADATEKQKVSLLKSGAADYVTKPIDIRLLTSVLDRLLPGGADISLPRSLFSCD